jgi:hypothetical protein
LVWLSLTYSSKWRFVMFQYHDVDLDVPRQRSSYRMVSVTIALVPVVQAKVTRPVARAIRKSPAVAHYIGVFAQKGQ